MYNSLNWPSYNQETLGFLNNNSKAQKIVATDALSVGIHTLVQIVVQFGLPDSLEELLQKFGRIRINKGSAQAILYIPPKSESKARKALEMQQSSEPGGPQFGQEVTEVANGDDDTDGDGDGDADNDMVDEVVQGHDENKHEGLGNGYSKAISETKTKQKRKKTKRMDLGVAKLILNPCIPAHLDEEFDNKPELDSDCGCKTCRDQPVYPPRSKDNCICSGCRPEEKTKQTRAPRAKPINTKPEGSHVLTTAM